MVVTDKLSCREVRRIRASIRVSTEKDDHAIVAYQPLARVGDGFSGKNSKASLSMTQLEEYRKVLWCM
jgi:hypothetical protein